MYQFTSLCLGMIGIAVASGVIAWNTMNSRLGLTIINGQSKEAERLVRGGANPNSIGPGGYSVLDLATGMGDVNLVRLLLERHADVNIRSYSGRTALMVAAHTGNLRIMQLLVENGASIDLVTEDGWSALMEAAASGQTQAAIFLLQHGATNKLKNREGLNPESLARRAEHAATAQAIRRYSIKRQTQFRH